MTLRHTFAVAVFATIIGWLIMFSSITLDPVALGFIVLGVALVLWYDFFMLWLMLRRDEKEAKAYREQADAQAAQDLASAEAYLVNRRVPLTQDDPPPLWDGK